MAKQPPVGNDANKPKPAGAANAPTITAVNAARLDETKRAAAPAVARPAAAASAPAKPAAPAARPAAPAGKAMPAAQAPAATAAKSSTVPPSEGPKSKVEELEELEQMGKLPWMTLAPSYLISALVHMVLLLILTFMVMPEATKDQIRDMVLSSEGDNPEPLDEIAPPQEELKPVDVNVTETSMSLDASSIDSPEVAIVDDVSAAPVSMELSNIGLQKAPPGLLTQSIGAFNGTGLDGRGDPKKRAALAMSNGGSDASEAAVALALQWFANHQSPDGSWSLDHTKGPCAGRCKDPGSMQPGNITATSFALLAFLGAGQTHKQGKYKDNVYRGLQYLGGRAKLTPNGINMIESGGSMYTHGLCSIALCEAYAMTNDKALIQAAQGSLNFICYAQDPVGGGWRYAPKQPGDTSVVGWQLMALKSGHMAYLSVPPNVIKGAENFLNLVQTDSGSSYGYATPGAGPATSAVGLLCRMYLGWKHEEPALQRGVEKLSKMGPSKNNMYYNYYATQVLHHYEGELWTKWNNVMRDQLVNSQSKAGHEAGSWFFGGGDHGSERGGRVYTTAMSTLTLEVYYRHLPIYRKTAADDEFN